MTQEPTETLEPPLPSNSLSSPQSSQDGFLPCHPSGLGRRAYSSGTSVDSQRSSSSGRRDSLEGVDADQLDDRLRGLRLRNLSERCPPAPGQRILEYENALTPQSLKQGAVRRSEPSPDGIQLNDFPNEILTHIFSHLPPDCHASIALVSKRFWALVTTHHAWRMAFMRYFPGHAALETKIQNASMRPLEEPTSDVVRYETRYFPRLTVLATWRNEYVFRTRHLRSLARGKPGTPSGVGSSGRGKKTNAVLTYNSKLPWQVTNIQAVFSNGKKPPRVIQGARDLGTATMSDPTTGKIEKWGLEDLFSTAQLDEVAPDLVPYGLGEGPAAVPNAMDVSQLYGMIAGEGFPGGRPFFRGANELRGRYLGAEAGLVGTCADIPRIPDMADAICSVWIAKSSTVASTTQSMCGMLTGSALGVVTAYSLGWDITGPRYANGDVTARWVLSPGVPVISLKVDDYYSQKRKSTARVWAVALNALGEVYCLTEAPVGKPTRSAGEVAIKNAWHAGRTVYWHLLEATRRVAREVELDNNLIQGDFSPRSPSNCMNISNDQLAAEAREIEKFMRHKPAYFRQVCDGWDMQRRLEVDFAGDDSKGAGENIFVFNCGLAKNSPVCIQRYSRYLLPQQVAATEPVKPSAPIPAGITSSLFGAADLFSDTTSQVLKSQSPLSPPPTPKSPPLPSMTLHDWSYQALELKGRRDGTISAVAMDNSSTSLLTLAEDPLHTAHNESMSRASPWADQGAGEIPGSRARFIAVGTNNGVILIWNARDDSKTSEIPPIRIIQTDSSEITALASTGLYLVHGGSDGLVQAWDPLASTTDPIRTINGRSHGRVPRHMLVMNPTLHEGSYSAVGAICLDPDPTVLRGVASFGAFLRYWSYSSTSHATRRMRQMWRSDIDGRLASRRQSSAVNGYIAAEEAELRRQNEQRARERAHLLKRFGALGDLTEEEAVLYAKMVSEEAYLLGEQRRASDSAADASFDAASSFSESTTETLTPEPSVAGPLAPETNSVNENGSEYEQQIQQAIRLSLMEEVGQSQGNSSGDLDFPINIKYKPKSGKKGKRSEPSGASSAGHMPMGGSPWQTATQDDDLALALSLSLQDQGGSPPSDAGLGIGQGDFPLLPGDGFVKGKGIQR